MTDLLDMLSETDDDECYFAMECRTGKTLTALETARRYGATSVLFITKKKAISSVKSDYDLLSPSYDIHVTNYESAGKIQGVFDLIIIDEAHALGAFPKPSARTKLIKSICKDKPIIYLSGTPSPESYSQLYHQFWVSSYSPFDLWPNFYKWAKTFVAIKERTINGHPVNDYSDAVKHLINPYIKPLFIDYTQEEAGFDAHIIERVLEVPMNEWTSKAIRKLKRDGILSWDNVVVLGDTPVKKLSKIHQLGSGTVISENDDAIITDYSKAQFIRTYFKGKKIAIFYVFQSELKLLKKAFPNWTNKPEVFQRESDKVFIAQVRSAREGVRLDTADALIYYNIEWSYLSYEQGRNRLSSKERTSPANVYFICSDCGIERDIMSAVNTKQDFTTSYYYRKHRHG